MRRADRLFQLVQILRRGNIVTAQSMAEELEISVRTVYRDLQALSARGIPLRAETGVGYQLEAGFDIPPLMFNQQEIEALVIASRMLAAWADPQTQYQIRSALEKIEQALPKRLRNKPANVKVFAPGSTASPTIWRALPDVRLGIDQRRKIRFQYIDEQCQSSSRTIRPLAVYFWGRTWTCIGWCELRDDFRHFRLDRMAQCLVTLETFTDQPGQSLADFEATLTTAKCHRNDTNTT